MIKRRLLAAILLFGFAVGSAFFWRSGELDWVALGINLIAASAGLLLLHLRWRGQEQRAMTPKKVRDIFS